MWLLLVYYHLVCCYQLALANSAKNNCGGVHLAFPSRNPNISSLDATSSPAPYSEVNGRNLLGQTNKQKKSRFCVHTAGKLGESLASLLAILTFFDQHSSYLASFCIFHKVQIKCKQKKSFFLNIWTNIGLKSEWVNKLRDERMARNPCSSNTKKIQKSKPGRCFKLHGLPSRAQSLMLN